MPVIDTVANMRPTSSTIVAFVAAAAAAGLAWSQTRVRLKETQEELREAKRRVAELLEAAERKEKQRQDERRGRVAAEKELRRVMDESLDTSNGIYVQALGVVHSCFHSCLGTPRQGLFAPSTRGKLVFRRNVSPEALDGLQNFTHVWIVFVFHQNTNGRNARAHEGLRSDSHRHTFKAKVAPPRLKKRVGIFSTRSPHRPNPIGITLAKIESVDQRNRTIHLSALDLVDGTPVLDIKPYIPAYDSVPTAGVASWVSHDLSPTVHAVRWRKSVPREVLHHVAARSVFYRDDVDGLRAAIEEVLLADVRSKDQTKRREAVVQNHIVLDNARISYRMMPGHREAKADSQGEDTDDAVEITQVDVNEPNVAMSPSFFKI